MGRYSYIPLHFENLESGLEREIIIKSDTDDIYVLDDYKIPVSATKDLRKNVNELEQNVDNLLDKSDDLVEDYLEQKDRLIVSKDKLDDLIDLGENDYFKRINGLEDYSKYLKSFYAEVKQSFDDMTGNLNDMVDTYIADLDSILLAVRNKYNNSLSLYNTYVSYKNQHNSAVTSMENDINELKRKLPLKLKKLGVGSGTWDGTITVGGKVVKRATSGFRWLSNSSTHYPGNVITDNMNYTAWFKYKSPQPHKPDSFINNNVTSGNIEDFRGPANDVNKYLVRWSWRDGNDDPPIKGNYVSDTGYRNTYAKWVTCEYEKEFDDRVQKPIHIDI